MYTKSSAFDKLNTGKSARLRRALQAISNYSAPGATIDNLRAGRQASASVCVIKGLEVLISYTTPVAFRHLDGSCVCVERNYYSKTTTRSQDEFVRPSSYSVAWMKEEDFRECLRRVLNA